MSVNQRPKVAYSLSQPYFNASPLPILSGRDPLASDFAEIGTEWINQTTNTVWALTNIVLNQSIWVELDNNAAPLGITWHIIPGTGPSAMAANSGYYLTNPTAVGLVLPVVAPLGSQFYVATANASAANAGFTVAQNNNQYILFGNDSSTVGAMGSAQLVNDLQVSVTLFMICTVANLEFTIFSTNVNPNLV